MKFSAIVATRAAYLDLQRGFAAKLTEMDAITQAAEGRIAAEKAQSADRAAVLCERIDNPATPPSVVRLAESELAQLETITVEATAQEQEAFEAVAQEAENIIQDMTKLRGQFGDEIAEVQAAIAAMRSEVLGDEHKDLRSRWLDGAKERFSRVCG